MKEYQSLRHMVRDCKYHVVWVPRCRGIALCESLGLQRGKSAKLFWLKNQKDHDLYFGYSKLYGMVSFRHRAKNLGHLSTCVALVNHCERTISSIGKPSKRLSQNLLMPVIGANPL